MHACFAFVVYKGSLQRQQNDTVAGELILTLKCKNTSRLQQGLQVELYSHRQTVNFNAMSFSVTFFLQAISTSTCDYRNIKL